MKYYYLSYNISGSDVTNLQIYIFKSNLSLDKVKYIFDIHLGPEEITEDGSKFSINTLSNITRKQYKSYHNQDIMEMNIAAWFSTEETSGPGLQKIKNYFLLLENKDVYKEFADYIYEFPPTQEEYLIKNIIE